jgi:hypothetical protein
MVKSEKNCDRESDGRKQRYATTAKVP